MSALAPFSGAPTRADMLLVAKMGLAQVYGDLMTAAQALTAIGGGSIYVYPLCLDVAPAIVVGRMASGINVVSVGGTTNSYQWVGNVLGGGLAPSALGTGQVGAWWQLSAVVGWARIKAAIANGQPTVFVGHSLGAAVAAILASYAEAAGLPVQGVYILGSPQVGDATWTASLGAPVYSWYTVGDPVGSLPSAASLGWLAPWPWSIPIDTSQYVPVGAQSSIDGAGRVTPGYAPVPVPEIIATLIEDECYPHCLPYYVRWLRVGFGSPADLTPGADGYASPWVLADLPQQLGQLPGAPAVGPAVPYGWVQCLQVQPVECDGSIVRAVETVCPPPAPVSRQLYGPPVPLPDQCC